MVRLSWETYTLYLPTKQNQILQEYINNIYTYIEFCLPFKRTYVTQCSDKQFTKETNKLVFSSLFCWKSYLNIALATRVILYWLGDAYVWLCDDCIRKRLYGLRIALLGLYIFHMLLHIHNAKVLVLYHLFVGYAQTRVRYCEKLYDFSCLLQY
jgi:hypothetical protein